MGDYQTFVVPYDFSSHAAAALGAATRLAKRLGADVHLVHVIPMPSYAYIYAADGAAMDLPAIDMDRVRADSRAALEKVAAALTSEGLGGDIQTHVGDGVGIADVICETAESLGADLIVMGTHGRTGLAHTFLGSVAERTLRMAPCPVLTVRADDEKAAPQSS